ncbi:hydroxyacid dehydrogenase [soil metagenome]
MPLIYSTHALHPDAQARLERLGNFAVATKLSPETFVAESTKADLVIVRASISSDLIAAARNLRAAMRHGAGLDMIPVDACTMAGVLVTNVPGANAVTVAEYVIFSALALRRRFRMIDHDLRTEGWVEGRYHADFAGEISGAVIGIIGMGSIGRAIAKITADGFSMRVLGHSRSNRNFPPQVEPVTLDDLLQQSDIIALACPLNDETRDIIGAKQFSLMKPGALLINVSRGPVVVESALLEALESGQLGGAALDVFSEQPLPRDHPLFKFPNVTLTPHCAGITEESMLRMGLVVADDAARILNNELPANLRNPEAVESYRRRFPERA